MSIIHVADASGKQTEHAEGEARSLWQQGLIARESLYWREGMADWRPVAEFFETVAAPPVMVVRVTRSVPQVRFVKDPAGLTKFLKAMMWIYLAAAVGGGGGLGVMLVTQQKGGGLGGQFKGVKNKAEGVGVSGFMLMTQQAGEGSSARLSVLNTMQELVGLGQLVIFIVTGITFLRWIHRANVNVRGFGAEGMTFTPGWSVGWYFVPIANL